MEKDNRSTIFSFEYKDDIIDVLASSCRVSFENEPFTVVVSTDESSLEEMNDTGLFSDLLEIPDTDENPYIDFSGELYLIPNKNLVEIFKTILSNLNNSEKILDIIFDDNYDEEISPFRNILNYSLYQVSITTK